MKIRRDWSEAENLAIALAWNIMLAATERGDKFNKSAIRRELIGTEEQPGPLHNRSNGSIEAKLMNCSAVAIRLGYPVLPGYKPAPNYQASLMPAMVTAYEMVRDDSRHGIATDISVAVA